MLSKSRILLYEECPWHYKKRYLEKIQDPPSKAMKRGSLIHKALENFYLDPRIHPVKEKFLSDNDLENLRKDLMKIGSDQAVRIGGIPESWVNNFVEFNIAMISSRGDFVPAIQEGYMKNQALNLCGIVDRVDCSRKGEWAIIDYKSGKKKTKLSSSNILELSIYAMLVQNHFGGEVKYIGIFYADHPYQPQKNPVISILKPEYIENALGRTAATQIGISQSNFPKQPGFYCRWCNLERTIHCEGRFARK